MLTEQLRTIPPEEAVKKFNEISLGDESPQTLRVAARLLWEIAFLSSEEAIYIYKKDPNLLYSELTRESRWFDDPTLAEAKILMNEFHLPQMTRRAFLLSLVIAEWLPGSIEMIKPTNIPETIWDTIRNICTEDFEGKLNPNTPQSRGQFLFNLVNYLIQYSAEIYSPQIGWEKSRQKRSQTIEREDLTGKRFMTIFIPTP